MKKLIASFLILICLGAFSWAQGTKTELFDTKKAQEELEIMKGILSTTLSFVTQSMQQPKPSTGRGVVSTPFGGAAVGGTYGWRTSNMNAFYLYGQGAVFMIPTSGLRVLNYYEGADRVYAEALQTTGRDMERLTRDVERQAVAVARAAGAGTAPPAKAAAPPPNPPAPAAPAQPLQVDKEELKKKVAELQEKAKKSREEAEANRAKFMANLAEVKGYLIEALANYGDSLTVVKPGEYISVVILTDSFSGDWVTGGGQDRGREIITVQKSWITDYKAGRLTLEAFKQKALQYSE